MVVKMEIPNVTKRGDRFHFRMSVPEDLREHFGKREIKKSLGTADPTVAKQKADTLRQEWTEQFEAARSPKETQGDSSQPETSKFDLKALMAKYEAHLQTETQRVIDTALELPTPDIEPFKQSAIKDVIEVLQKHREDIELEVFYFDPRSVLGSETRTVAKVCEKLLGDTPATAGQKRRLARRVTGPSSWEPEVAPELSESIFYDKIYAHEEKHLPIA